jgi:hypothetical protein
MAPLILNLDTMEVNDQHRAPADLPPGEERNWLSNRRLGEPQRAFGYIRQDKTLASARIEPRTIQPVVEL